MEIDYKHQIKPQSSKDAKGDSNETKKNEKNNESFHKSNKGQKGERGSKKNGEGDRRKEDKMKKWREKDKKQLFERVKEKYLQYRKMKIFCIRVDPFRRKNGSDAQRKRSKKRQVKKEKSLV